MTICGCAKPVHVSPNYKANCGRWAAQVESVDGADLQAWQEYPSLRELPILGVTYSDLSRQLMMQENIYETLTKQYELAKVEEAKEIPPVKVLDEPEVAERKSLPHRLIIVALGTVLSAFAGIAWVFVGKLWESTKDSHSTRTATK